MPLRVAATRVPQSLGAQVNILIVGLDNSGKTSSSSSTSCSAASKVPGSMLLDVTPSRRASPSTSSPRARCRSPSSTCPARGRYRNLWGATSEASAVVFVVDSADKPHPVRREG